MKTLFLLVLVVCGILLAFLGLRSQQFPDKGNSKFSVVASFYPIAEFSSRIGGNAVTVTNLTPSGSEPHDFDPSPKDLAAVQNSKLFVYNGAGLEIWLSKIGEDVKAHTIEVNASQGIELLKGQNEDANSSESIEDPHVWMDPVLASQQVENIKKGFVAADPNNAGTYEMNAKAYKQELASLDSEFKNSLAKCERHEIVTSHNAFTYMAKRYGLTVKSISGLSPDEEPSPKKLSEVVQFTRAHGVRYIFFETLVSPKLAETIAKETGAQVIMFNPLEGLSKEEIAQGKNYISVQKENLHALQIALGCQ